MKTNLWKGGPHQTIRYLTLGTTIVLLSGCGPQTTATVPSDDGTTPAPTTNTVTITTTTTSVPVTPGPTSSSLFPSLSPLTQANLDKLSKDMSPAQVTAVLGQPTSSDTKPIPIVGGTETTYQYDDGKSSATIVFKNNLLQTKSGTFGPAQ